MLLPRLLGYDDPKISETGSQNKGFPFYITAVQHTAPRDTEGKVLANTISPLEQGHKGGALLKKNNNFQIYKNKMHGWMDGQMEGQTDGWTGRWVDG